jgi:O-antigen/teichoic acid export membrane protein
VCLRAKASSYLYIGFRAPIGPTGDFSTGAIGEEKSLYTTSQRGPEVTIQRRLLTSYGASVLGPLVTILVQLVNVPFMLRVWGPHLYGEWILISTIPAYLLLTDLGFGNVAGSDMTMRVNASDREGAIETFQSTSILVLSISALLGAVLCLCIYVLPLYRILHLSSMTPREMKSALLVLCVNCLVILQWSVILSAYRCAGEYARGMLFVNLIRIVEGISFLALLFVHAGPVQLSLLMLGISIIGTVWLVVAQRRLVPWLPYGTDRASWERVRSMARPAFAFMAFPAGSAINLQGTTLVIGMVLGPLAVATFNPMRTLSRAVFQLTDAVKNSVWPELSAAYGQGNWPLARRLHRASCQVSILLALLASIVLVLFGPQLFERWTRGRVSVDVPMFYILLAAVLANSGWNASSTVPLAANRHQRLAATYLVCTAGSLLLCWVLTSSLGLRGSAAALLVCDCAMSVFVVRMSNRLVFDRWSGFAASMLDLTELNALRIRLFRRLA